MDNTFKSPLTSISIGPGILGIERGVERVARLVHLAYVEIEAFIIENLVAQMERGVLAPAVIWSDCKTLPCLPFRGLVDILFAGYPCQPFSTAGKRRGTEDPRHLFPYIERAVGIIRPRICFFENVRGHVTCGLPEVIASLEGLGYRVHWGIYSAQETGAAHKRERVFIMAISNNVRIDRFIKYAGRRHESSNNGSELADAIGHGEELENPNSGGLSGSGVCEKQPGRTEIISTSENAELAYSGSERHIQRATGEQSTDGRIYAQHDIAASGSETVGLADSDITGLQELPKQSEQEEQQTAGRGRRIVSRPGEPQQAWEHPRVISRTVESAVGLSAHGYHFREDVLRALGNSVYTDTAELAFRDLLRKHGLSNR